MGHPEIVDEIHRLQAGGWEVGVHGSLAATNDPNRLAEEKQTLEEILGKSVTGGRQHHLDLSLPETWRYQRTAGFSYDSSLGSSKTTGFRGIYRPIRPFGDEFVVLPLTIMDVELPDPEECFDEAWNRCEQLLRQAQNRSGVMTVCWHPMYFNSREFPGYKRLYRSLVERALKLGAWVGLPRSLYHRWCTEPRPEDGFEPAHTGVLIEEQHRGAN